MAAMSSRSSEAGVTLIEMLVAISISAMIGLAGFVLLDSVTRTETGVAGELSRLEQQDRAFTMFARDLDAAFSIAQSEARVTFDLGQMTATWQASEIGFLRQLSFPDRATVAQRILEEPTQFTHNQGFIILRLTEPSVERVFALP